MKKIMNPVYYIYSKIFLFFTTCFLGLFILYFTWVWLLKSVNSILQWAKHYANSHLDVYAEPCVKFEELKLKL